MTKEMKIFDYLDIEKDNKNTIIKFSKSSFISIDPYNIYFKSKSYRNIYIVKHDKYLNSTRSICISNEGFEYLIRIDSVHSLLSIPDTPLIFENSFIGKDDYSNFNSFLIIKEIEVFIIQEIERLKKKNLF